MKFTPSLERRGLLALSLAFAFGGACAQAGDYPNKQIRIVVPFTAGGSSDLQATTLSHSCCPPRERGTTWSMLSAWLPQYWQV